MCKMMLPVLAMLGCSGRAVGCLLGIRECVLSVEAVSVSHDIADLAAQDTHLAVR